MRVKLFKIGGYMGFLGKETTRSEGNQSGTSVSYLTGDTLRVMARRGHNGTGNYTRDSIQKREKNGYS